MPTSPLLPPSTAPHTPLNDLYGADEGKPAFVNLLFDAGAKHYDLVSDWGFLHSGPRYWRSALKRHGLRPGQRYLDVATGTGMVAVQAARILGSSESVTCLDPSEGMLDQARRKLDARFVVGRAERLPFPDAAFDFLTMANALRHVTTLEAAFGEFHRVLRPGGRVLIFEVTKPRGRVAARLFDLHFGVIYPFLTRILTRSRDAEAMMRYYWKTMDAAAGSDAILGALRTVGFADVKHSAQLSLFTTYTGERKASDPVPPSPFRP
jgi:demethylmenaquinone methyltransferase/2-methoxy-6-polyprenyl-1,4-benzoquinol methylase